MHDPDAGIANKFFPEWSIKAMESDEFGDKRKYPGAGCPNAAIFTLRSDFCALADAQITINVSRCNVTGLNIIASIALFVCLGTATTVSLAQAIIQPDIKGFFNFERVGGAFRLGVNVAREFDDAILLGSGTGLVRSTDEGRTWVHILRPLQRKDITSVVVYKGDIIVGSANGGIYRSTDRGLYWDRFGSEPGVLRIKSLLRVKEGYLSLNDSGTCYRRNDASDKWLAIPLPSPCTDVAIFQDRAWFICKNGAVLEDTGEGLKKRNTVQVTYRTSLVATNDFLAVVLDSVVVVLNKTGDSVTTWPLPIHDWSACASFEDQLLIGGRGTGLKRINLETGETTFAFAGPAEHENISALAVSADTIVVGTTKSEGRCYVIPQSSMQWHSLNTIEALQSFDVTALAYVNGLVYVSAREEGLHVGKVKETFITAIHEAYDRASITQLEPLRDEMLVVGRRTGIWRMKRGSERLEWFSKTLPFSFDYLACVIGTRVVVGQSGGGILWSDDDGGTWATSSDTLPQINHMCTIGKSTFASTFQGLYRSDNRGETWHVVPGPWQGKYIMWVMGVTDSLVASTATSSYISIDNQPPLLVQVDSLQPSLAPFVSVQLYRGLILGTGLFGVYVSADGGVTWERTTIPNSRAVIVQFFYKDFYYVFNNEGELWRSTAPQ